MNGRAEIWTKSCISSKSELLANVLTGKCQIFLSSLPFSQMIHLSRLSSEVCVCFRTILYTNGKLFCFFLMILYHLNVFLLVLLSVERKWCELQFSFYLFPALLRYNWNIHCIIFKVYNAMIRYMYMLNNIYQNTIS